MKNKRPGTCTEIVNFYKELPEDLVKKYHNPNYANHGIKVPFRMLIIGSSGSGKTNLLLEIIKRMNGTFEQIVICVKNKDEPLYNYLEQRIPDGLDIFEGVDNIPDMDKYDKGMQKLIVFDDMINEEQKSIAEYFIRARKMNFCCIYLSQSYYKTPKIIRQNINYLAIIKLSSKSDLMRILREYSLNVDKPKLEAHYKEATKEQMSFLLIDIDAPDDEKFRKNFLIRLT